MISKYECGQLPTRFSLVILVCAARTLFFCLDSDLPSLVHRREKSQSCGALRRGLSEHVAAQQIVRVPQPRLIAIFGGYPAGAGNLGSPSLAYLSWRSKKGMQLPGCPRRSCFLKIWEIANRVQPTRYLQPDKPSPNLPPVQHGSRAQRKY